MAGRRNESDERTTLSIDRRRGETLFLHILGEGPGATHLLPESGAIVIGRGAQADVRINDASVSRRHALLHVGAALEIEDLGGANGTRVGDRPLKRGERRPVALGEMVDLGSVMLVVQRGAIASRSRQIWPHAHFERRLEGECVRAELSGTTFAVVRLHVEALALAAIEETLGNELSPSDLAASYGPDEYEVLFAAVTPGEAGKLADALAARLRERGSKTRVGLACFPRDGHTPESLVARSCNEVLSGGDDAPPLVVADEAMRHLHRLVERVAAGNISVFLRGETGVGKEVVAELVHRRSPRAARPFLRLNCAAFAESLLESELFGHEKGTFTGATESRPGLLEAADRGTVLLDEVGELPLSLQAKLLRVLEERKVLRVGARKPRAIDVRFIAATNRDLEAAITDGRFRQDLFFRLNGITIVVPPLRERVSEIEPLARAFLAEASRQMARPASRLSPDALALLRAHRWPGNVRELRNVIGRAVLLSTGDRIEPMHLSLDQLPAFAPAPRVARVAGSHPPQSDLREEIQSLERERIIATLSSCAGNQSRAAKLLGISRATLLARLDRFGLPRPRKA